MDILQTYLKFTVLHLYKSVAPGSRNSTECEKGVAGAKGE